MLESLLALQPSTLILLPPLLLAIYIIYNLFLHPLRHIPGPLLGRISPLWLWYHSYIGNEATTIHELHSSLSSPILRVAPNEIYISSPSALIPIYSERGGFHKSKCYKNFDIDGWPSIFSALEPTYRSIRSKAIIGMFARGKVREEGDPLIEEYADRLVARIQEAKVLNREKGNAVDILGLARRLAVDAVTGYLFKKAYGALDEGVGTGAEGDEKAKLRDEEKMSATAMVDSFVAVGRFFLLPNWLFMQTEALSAKLFPDAGVDRSIGMVDSYCNGIAQEAAEQTDDSIDTYQRRLIKAGISVSETAAQCKDLIFAGTDSSAMNVATVCWNLTRNPGQYKRLREELAQKQGSGADPQTFPYLSAVIKEGLRISLANPPRLPRETPAAGWSFEGYYMPPGMNVGCATYSMHHNEDAFPDSFSFMPERWLGDEGEITNSEKRSNSSKAYQAFMPFGLGPRACIARNLATAAVFIAIRKIVESNVLEGARTVQDEIQVLEWFNGKVKGEEITFSWK